MTIAGSESHATIYRELLRFGGFYGIDENRIRPIIDRLAFDTYTEIILKERGLEVVVGGVGRAAYLLDLAARFHADDEMMRIFDDLTRTFPSKMAYLKFDLTPNGEDTTFYSTVIEPWEPALAFLSRIPSVRPALPALQPLIAPSPICFMLAMRRGRGNVVVKTYHLADRRSDASFKPTIVSHRLCDGAVADDIKYYTVGVAWEQLRFDARWADIVDFAKSVLGERHLLVLGERRQGERVAERKAYVFRYDSRQTDGYTLKSYNFYRHEGFRLIELGRYRDAVRSFTNAIDLHGDDAHSYNDRGFCFLQLGDYARAIEDCATAVALDGRIASTNLEVARRLKAATANGAGAPVGAAP